MALCVCGVDSESFWKQFVNGSVGSISASDIAAACGRTGIIGGGLRNSSKSCARGGIGIRRGGIESIEVAVCWRWGIDSRVSLNDLVE